MRSHFQISGGQLEPFAFDWMGRIWAAMHSDEPHGVFAYVLDPVGGSLRAPGTFDDFHVSELPDNLEEDLNIGLFGEWINDLGHPLDYDKCAGYKVPPFLGGDLSVSNLEQTEIDVHWELTIQMLRKVKNNLD